MGTGIVISLLLITQISFVWALWAALRRARFGHRSEMLEDLLMRRRKTHRAQEDIEESTRVVLLMILSRFMIIPCAAFAICMSLFTIVVSTRMIALDTVISLIDVVVITCAMTCAVMILLVAFHKRSIKKS